MRVLICSERIYMFFFFKQKTAYEMRISDWSSDVCSSDLRVHAYVPGRVGIHPGRVQAEVAGVGLPAGGEQHRVEGFRDTGDAHAAGAGALECGHVVLQAQRDAGLAVVLLQPLDQRSEEHTSELQSLMRISYAVFCLKKKNHMIL